jgi:hypothetical protein
MIKIGDIVKVISPGFNFSSAWDMAREMGSKYYKGGQLYDKEWWVNVKFKVINCYDITRDHPIFLIRNEILQRDLIIEERGLSIEDDYGYNLNETELLLGDKDLLI